jgi:hypothetical protein
MIRSIPGGRSPGPGLLGDTALFPGIRSPDLDGPSAAPEGCLITLRACRADRPRITFPGRRRAEGSRDRQRAHDHSHGRELHPSSPGWRLLLLERPPQPLDATSQGEARREAGPGCRQAANSASAGYTWLREPSRREAEGLGPTVEVAGRRRVLFVSHTYYFDTCNVARALNRRWFTRAASYQTERAIQRSARRGDSPSLFGESN